MTLSFRKYFLLLLATVFIFSCTKKKPTIPRDVIPLKQMVEIMTDVHLVEAAKAVAMPDDQTKYTTQEYYTSVFSKHHITREQFEHSFDFYKTKPEFMEEIYTEIINKLSEMQAKTGNH